MGHCDVWSASSLFITFQPVKDICLGAFILYNTVYTVCSVSNLEQMYLLNDTGEITYVIPCLFSCKQSLFIEEVHSYQEESASQGESLAF